MNMNDENLKAIGEFIMPRTPIVPVDIAIAFGTPHSCDVFANHIYDLWNRKLFKVIILTGGSKVKNIDDKESTYLKKLLLNLGMPIDAIETEEKSTNTGENIEYSLPILKCLKHKGYSLEAILGIGKVFATRRCLMTMEKYLPRCKKYFSSINTFDVDLEHWTKSEALVKKVLGENTKIPLYLEKGFISNITLESHKKNDTSRGPCRP